jgi:cytochrome c5
MKKALFAITLLAGFSIAHAADDGQSREDISENIRPVGQVHIGSGKPAAPAGPRSGEDVYKASCFACHGTGAMDAPKPGDSAEWEKRLGKGFDAVLQNAINGINAMPARGTCANCSDDEIKAAVEFLIK